MQWLLVGFRPLSGLLFRSPGSVYEAGLHGPAAAASSLSYPLPSTLAGALSALAYREGLCKPSGHADFSDHEVCLEALFGEGFSLRPGLAVVDGRFYAYLGTPELADLEGLRVRADDAGRIQTFRVGMARVAGVALDRKQKTVVEGMLYNVGYADYGPGASIVLLAGPGWRAKARRWTTPLGGDARAALAWVEEGGYDPAGLLVSGRGVEWEALLLTPALLEYEHEDPQAAPGIGGEGRAVFAGEGLARELARALLAQSEPGVRDCVKNLEVKVIPRGELQLEVLAPGWSVAKGAPREPHLLVPPGTRMTLKASRECAEEVARLGLGAHSRLGWGTVLLRPPPGAGGS